MESKTNDKPTTRAPATRTPLLPADEKAVQAMKDALPPGCGLLARGVETLLRDAQDLLNRHGIKSLPGRFQGEAPMPISINLTLGVSVKVGDDEAEMRSFTLLPPGGGSCGPGCAIEVKTLDGTAG